jgi:hypothetical protein
MGKRKEKRARRERENDEQRKEIKHIVLFFGHSNHFFPQSKDSSFPFSNPFIL